MTGGCFEAPSALDKLHQTKRLPPDGTAQEHVQLQSLTDNQTDESGFEERGRFIVEGESYEGESGKKNVLETQELSFGKKIFFTVSIYASFLCLGLTSASLGPALIDLDEVFYTDTKTIVVVFTCVSVGYLAGTILSGFLVNKLEDGFFFFVISVGMSAFLAMSVWIRELAVFCVFMTLSAAFQGGGDCVGQVSILKLWHGNRHQNSVIQGIHFMWSVGATLSPLIIKLFISEDVKNSNIHLQNSSIVLDSLNYSNDSLKGNVAMETKPTAVYSINITVVGNGSTSSELRTHVQYGILTVGSISLLMSLLCFIAFILDGWKIRKLSQKKSKLKGGKKQTKLFKAVMIVCISFLYYFYICTEQTTGNLLATFVVEGLKWEKFKGPLITSVFWGVFGIGRLVGIPLSTLLSPVQMMYVDSSIVCLGFTLLLALIHIHEAITWVGFGLVGLGMGSFFAAGFSFINLYLTVDGLVSASILGASSVSSMTMTPLTGLIFKTYGPMSMIYILFSSSVLVLISFLGLHIFAKRFSTRSPELTGENSSEVIYT